jgi:hypothetical protein
MSGNSSATTTTSRRGRTVILRFATPEHVIDFDGRHFRRRIHLFNRSVHVSVHNGKSFRSTGGRTILCRMVEESVHTRAVRVENGGHYGQLEGGIITGCI